MIMKENKLYTSIFNAADFDRILSSAVCRKQIAEAGYERMKESGTLDPDLWYFVYSDAQFTQLARICVGPTLLIEVEDRMEGIMKEEKMTMEQYLQLRQQRKTVPGTWYSIFTDYAHKNLVAVYNGNKLIMKGADGTSKGFPLVFPYTF